MTYHPLNGCALALARPQSVHHRYWLINDRICYPTGIASLFGGNHRLHQAWKSDVIFGHLGRTAQLEKLSAHIII